MALWLLISSILSCSVYLCFAALLIVVIFHRWKWPRAPKTIAFFHPYCSSGGGGERVVWKMVEALEPFDYSIVIYTADPPSETYMKDLMQHVQDRFSLTISPKRLSFIHLNENANLMRPGGSFTLLRESIGAMLLGYKALCRFTPNVFVDTTGYVATCTFSAMVCVLQLSDQFLKVWERRRSAYNHASYISSSSFITYVKLVYYVVFAGLYGCVGSLAEVVMVNSTWTYNHIRSLWRLSSNIQIVYPPCSLNADIQCNRRREPIILSIGQFRPEKDHVLQIEAMQLVAKKIPEAKLVLAGSCRNSSDRDRLEYLQSIAGPNVEFCVNQNFSAIAEFLSRSTVGIHTMWNEHFGIGIVEMMAAGLVVVAHNSGGPKADIIDVGRTGFLASTAEEYADRIFQIFDMTDEERREVSYSAIDSAKRFSDQTFSEAFQKIIVSMKI